MKPLRPQGVSSGSQEQLYREYRDNEPKTLKEAEELHRVLVQKKKLNVLAMKPLKKQKSF